MNPIPNVFFFFLVAYIYWTRLDVHKNELMFCELNLFYYTKTIILENIIDLRRE